MPWFPDFVSAVELARRQTQTAGQSDPVAQYLSALQRGDIHDLETAWPGKVVVHDPRAGDVRGHKHLRQFVRANHSLWAQHNATVTKVGVDVCSRGVRSSSSARR